MNSLYKAGEKMKRKKKALWPVCVLFCSLRGHNFLVSVLHSLAGLVRPTVLSITEKHKKFQHCKNKQQKNPLYNKEQDQFSRNLLPAF